jgi:hypothetical protein
VEDVDAHVKKLLPTGKVGLLFMAYNARLSEQFVFTQARWANAAGFPKNDAGLDPVIGRTDQPLTPQKWPKQWDDASSSEVSFDFHGRVTMKGGEYFFAPSLGVLKGL